MQKKLHRFVKVFLGAFLVTFLLLGCSFAADGSGTIKLSLTDAPIVDAQNVEGVFITIQSVEYNLNGAWIKDPDFIGPQVFNLLELTGGTVAPLSNTVIRAGEVTQIRFMLDVQEKGAAQKANPNNYILIDPNSEADGNYDDDVKHELFVPSGSQTGYKAVGNFTIPRNGEVEITADFDVRKSVVKRGGLDEYILKPTLRLVVNHQAGTIAGNFTTNLSTYNAYTIFAYANGSYTDTEAPSGTEDPDDTFIPFENAISSAVADPISNGYVLPFLSAGTYDLIIAGVADDGSYTVIDSTTYRDIVVESESTTTQDVAVGGSL
ncbi:hypothetical protein SpiGrapes_2310 [Sphaerochaeta pleomorpha str. Grapes]|uniref:DUF4382 domain-containing protein n=1 Tax=Sphaerochaeta pleomorpha (strain ATCC BAA-1885 / DSM 22778 / Grapes) TaxID=158190 RepID=G8QSF6_SPHPG|nr:DUF4382 domain-containing protein [Sphaerochaeta pleomorpha]AEV30086.1 hypothetical protein SpiGrapes_2310 [Sphaerochaeta pleomorpha str. Grapes]